MSFLCFALGAALACLAGVTVLHALWLLPLAAVSGLGWFIQRRKALRPVLRAALLGAAVALAWTAMYGYIFHAPADDLANRTVRLEAVVTGWPEEARYGVRVPVNAGEEGGRKVKAVFYGDEDLLNLSPGDRLASVAYCTPADHIRGEESFYYVSRGILLHCRGYGPVSITPEEGFPLRYGLSYITKAVRDRIDRLYPPEQAGFLRALLTGDKSGLTDIDQHNFNRVGLAHVVVISGLHVSFIAGFLHAVFDLRRKRTMVLTLAVLVLFSLITGNAPGTVRAVVLYSLSILAPHLNRQYNNLTGLGAALLLLLALNPWSIVNAGLQFSFLSTLGILKFGQK